MSAPFNVEAVPGGTNVWSVDTTGNTSQSGTMNCASYVAGASTQNGIQTYTALGGANTAAEAAGTILSTLLISNAQTSGTQLPDTTRDYECYVSVTGGGTNNTLLIGPNSTSTTATIWASATVSPGVSLNWRLPAGWFIRFTGTATLGVQTGVPC